MKRLAAVSTVLVALLFVAGGAGANLITNPEFNLLDGGWTFDSDLGSFPGSNSGYASNSTNGEFGLLDDSGAQKTDPVRLFVESNEFSVKPFDLLSISFEYDFAGIDNALGPRFLPQVRDDSFFLDIVYFDVLRIPTTFRLFSSNPNQIRDPYDDPEWVAANPDFRLGDPLFPSEQAPAIFSLKNLIVPTVARTASLYFGLTERVIFGPDGTDLTDSYVAIDNVFAFVQDPDPKPVPEPSTLLLLAGGLAGLAGLRRRMK